MLYERLSTSAVLALACLEREKRAFFVYLAFLEQVSWLFTNLYCCECSKGCVRLDTSQPNNSARFRCISDDKNELHCRALSVLFVS